MGPDRELSLHVANLGLILANLYDPQGPIKNDLEA